MKKKATLNILYQSDANMQYYMGVSIVSLLENNPDESINIYIIDIGIDSCFLDDLKKYTDGYNVQLIIIDGNKLKKQPPVDRFPVYVGMRKNKSSYLKLFWDIAIKDEIDRLIYIDCDTIVEGSIRALTEIDLDGKMLGMVCDSLITDEVSAVGLSRNDKYYNSGVILFDAVKWKNANASERIVEHAKKHKYGTVDQDLLNIEFKNEIACLPLEYNFQSIHLLIKPEVYCKEFKRTNYYDMENIKKAAHNIKIVHFLKFVGQNPWDRRNVHPCKKIFEKYLNMSPWKGLEKKAGKSNMIYTIEKILYILLPRRLFIKIFHMAHSNKINNSNKA